MHIFRTIDDIKNYSRTTKQESKSIGLVPTMGALHHGHMRLMTEAIKTCDVTVASIFVNPLQFAPSEDFNIYPRQEAQDINLLTDCGVDAVFIPNPETFYSPNFTTYVEVNSLSKNLCGKLRPTHFRGVATVILKLLHIVMPDTLFLGQKDTQQARIITQMLADLSMDTGLCMLPIVRETDGLAASSRNAMLSPVERTEACRLFHALNHASEAIRQGETQATTLQMMIASDLKKSAMIYVDYIAIVDYETLQPIETVGDNTLIAVAAFVGKTRLIDNTLLSFQENRKI